MLWNLTFKIEIQNFGSTIKYFLAIYPLVFYGEILKILVPCPSCTQVITDETYWNGPEPVDLCDDIETYLEANHGPPTITPVPSDPCTETLICDSTRYNRVAQIFYSNNVLVCGSDSVDLINNVLNPYTCDAANSGLFVDTLNYPNKAYLCYCDPNFDPPC